MNDMCGSCNMVYNVSCKGKEIRMAKLGHVDRLKGNCTPLCGQDQTMDNYLLMHMVELYVLEYLSKVHSYLM